MKRRRFVTVAAVAVAIALVAYDRYGASPPAGVAEQALSASDAALAAAFDQRASGIQVQGEGTVTKILSDDNDGSRHQRFIVRLRSGQTVLIAHNIDLAPRIDALREGDRVAFNGEYEWNPQGGVVHWTHHDPQGRHVSGWVSHGGRAYQ